MTHPTRRPQSSRTVPLIYGAVALIVLIVTAALALVFVPPSPPSIAEFAPQAQEAIEDAPDQQASQFGAGGEGRCAASQECDPAAEAAARQPQRAVIEKARIKRCVGSPPRQIEDPQSPPCVQFWEGDNGGATSKGVSGSEIRVALPSCLTANCPAIADSWAAFFNRRFELYGRSIRLFYVAAPGIFTETAQTQRQHAVKIDEEFNVFASLPYQDTVSADAPFYDELAERKIIGIQNAYSVRTEAASFSRRRPYLWNFRPAHDEMQANLGEWICKWLSGRRAQHGGPEMQARTRKFGLLLEREPAGVPSKEILERALGNCSESLTSAEYEHDPNQTYVQLRATLADFSRVGVTTVLCFCQQFERVLFFSEKDGYNPEWLVSDGENQGQDGDPKGANGAGYPPAQRARLFGIQVQNRWNSLGNSPWWWALREANPNFEPAQFSGSNANSAGRLRPVYEAMLLLASGIQMAGPKLTPESFERGLAETVFPNPGSGGPPYYQARVDFDYSNHTMVDDTALIWWSDTNTSESTFPPAGTYCSIGRGVRFRKGSWPTEPMPFFDPTTCR